jgi:hypothetical protein
MLRRGLQEEVLGIGARWLWWVTCVHDGAEGEEAGGGECDALGKLAGARVARLCALALNVRRRELGRHGRNGTRRRRADRVVTSSA